MEFLKKLFGEEETGNGYAWEKPLDGGTVEDWIAVFEKKMKEAHAIAVEKGWWETDRPDSEAIALIGREASEALEYMRENGAMSDHIPEFLGAEEELADVIIRTWDICAKRGYEVSDGLLDIIDPTGEGIDIDEDWSEGFDQAATMLVERGDLVGSHTSFATDIAAIYPILGELYNYSLDANNVVTMGNLYADLVAHTMAMSAKYNLNVANAVIAKTAYNKNRPHRHGGKKF